MTGLTTALQNWLDIFVESDFLSLYGWRKYQTIKGKQQAPI
jgi:hypothetical protein